MKKRVYVYITFLLTIFLLVGCSRNSKDDNAILLFISEEYEMSKSMFISIYENDNNNTNALYYVGICCMYLSEYELANEIFSVLLKSDQSNIEFLRNRALCRMLLTDYEQAILDFSDCILYDAKDRYAYDYRGCCYFLIGIESQAIMDLHNAEKLGYYSKANELINKYYKSRL